MSHAALSTTVGDENGSVMEGILPVDPFRSLYVHFGMLLGVEDFRTAEAYHRGKMWFHSAWLHGQGTLWGLEVLLNEGNGEVKVTPGAAVDALGRELYLGAPACLSLSEWYKQHKDDPELSEIVTKDPATGDHIFDAHVVIKFKACLSRQVPALREPCDGSNATTAYSRVIESVELCLKPGKAPEWQAPGQLPFHRLRLLFGLEEALKKDGAVIPEDEEVLTKRAWILGQPAAEQPAHYLEWLRYFAAKDEIEMTPAVDADGASFLFPASDPAPLPLANIEGVRLREQGDVWEVQDGEVKNTIRPVHLPTSTIQELLCGPICQCSGDAPPPVPPPADPPAPGDIPTPIPDAGGPRIDPATVELNGEEITMTLSGPPLMKASVDARALLVTAFDTRDGWISAEVKNVTYDSGQLKIELRDAPGGTLVRLIVKGTGAYPLLGRVGNTRIPLAGAVGGAPGGIYDGNDFVFMFKTGG